MDLHSVFSGVKLTGNLFVEQPGDSHGGYLLFAGS